MTKFRTVLTSTLVATTLFVPLSATMTAQPAVAAQQDIVGGDYTTHAQNILNDINAYRKSKGLKPVKYSATISTIAQDESNRAVRDENYNHSMRFLNDSRAGSWTHAGEVTALEYSVNSHALVNWWKKSPSHNKFLLNPDIDVIGIGVTFVDGNLSKTKQPWRIVGTVDGYGYDRGGAPADARTTVSAPPQKVENGSSGASLMSPGYISGYYNANKSKLGSPVRYKTTGLVQGGVVQQFMNYTNGARYSVYWSNTTGTHDVKTSGGIGATFANTGAERTHGYPKDNEKSKTYKNQKYAYQFFARNGVNHLLMWTPQHGTHVINERGAIGSTWAKAGREYNYGFPITDEYKGRDGKTYQKFSNGVTISWSPTQGTKVMK